MLSRLHQASRPALTFGVVAGVLAGARALLMGASPLVSLAAAAGTFGLFGGLAFVLQALGVAWSESPVGPINVSPWFAWLVAGAVAAFLAGLIFGSRQEPSLKWAVIAALAWCLSVAIARLIRRWVRRAA